MTPEILLARLDAMNDILKLMFDSIRRMRADIHQDQHGPPVPLGALTPTAMGGFHPAEPVPSPASTWIPILHSITRLEDIFPPACGKPGLYLTEPPRENQKARLEVMRILDRSDNVWRPPTPGDTPRCSSCQSLVDPFSNNDLDYLSKMQPAASKSPARARRKTGKTFVREILTEEMRPGVTGFPSSHSDSPPSIFPGHTSEATMTTLSELTSLARELGLPEPGVPFA